MDGAPPSLTCPAGYNALDPFWTVIGEGPLEGFSLELDGDTYQMGATLTAKLRNVTDEDQTSGAKSKFDIQYKDQRWYTIFGIAEDVDPIWPAVGVIHPPGEGFTWTLTLSQERLSEGSIESAPSFHACQSIKPGNYRFVYWGVGESKAAIGVPFTVVSS